MSTELTVRRAHHAATQARIKSMWKGAGHRAVSRLNVSNRMVKAEHSALGANGPGVSTYGASDVTETSADFLGDWRSADSMMRFDMFRVRYRSRQLEKYNPWCKSFSTSLVNNVLSHKGIKIRAQVKTSARFGDTTEGVDDPDANLLIDAVRKEFEKSSNYTNRKRL